MTRKQELELKRENGTITLDELKELRNIIKEEREEAGIIFLKLNKDNILNQKENVKCII